MGYLFDTDALSEVGKRRPNARYAQWLATVPRSEQFTSAIAVGELYAGAYESEHEERYLRFIREGVLAVVKVLPFEKEAAEVYGRIRAALRRQGKTLADPDIQIAATAIANDHMLVTGNVKHFERIDGLEICRALADARLTVPAGEAFRESAPRTSAAGKRSSKPRR